jgi:hypothetical protein
MICLNTLISEMSIAADDLPLPRRGHLEKKLPRRALKKLAAAAMVFKKMF